MVAAGWAEWAARFRAGGGSAQPWSVVVGRRSEGLMIRITPVILEFCPDLSQRVNQIEIFQ
jgi:hypothetical protein